MLDGGDHVVRPQHVLVQQIAERQIVRVVADRHHGDDLLSVQEQGQRPLVDDRGLDRAAGLVDAGDGLGQARVVRVGEQQGLAHGPPISFALCRRADVGCRASVRKVPRRQPERTTLPAKVRRPIPPRPRRGIARRLIGHLPALLLVGLAAWVVLFFAMAPRLPDTAELLADSTEARVTVLASDGVPIAIRGGGGQVVPLSAISPWLVDAVVATEDRRFFHHFGVDPIGLGRAALDNLRAGAVVAGGSTITQQLAKNLYLTPERSLARKLQELTLALWLEVRLSKKEILTLYLNRAYLGAGAYGVEAASRRYFGKSARRPHPARGGDAGRPPQGAVGTGADERSRPGTRARHHRARTDGSRGLHHTGAGPGGARRSPQSSPPRPRRSAPGSSTGCSTA